MADENNQAQVLVNLEGMIKTHITTLDKSRAELSKLKEMLDGILENDETYRTHTEKAKEAAKLKSLTKSQLLKQPEARDLAQKIKELQNSVKDLDLALSDYLREYFRMSGSTEIELENGEVREIVYTAKLVKRAQH